MARMTLRAALAVVCLVGSAAASALPIPAAAGPSQSLEHLRRSTSALWTNYKQCKFIRQQRKAGAALDFSAYWMLRRGAADRMKLFQVAWLISVAKWSTPFIMYFFPSVLPSTFETPDAFAKRLAEAEAVRHAALLDMLRRSDAGKMDGRLAYDAMTAGSKSKALQTLTEVPCSVSNIPLAAVHAASRSVSGPPKIAPKFFHMQAIRSALKNINEGDEALRNTKISTLPVHLLQEACAERGIASTGNRASKALCGELQQWLSLTGNFAKSHPDLVKEDRDQVALALYAINTASSIRSTSRTNSPLIRALYSRDNF